MELLLKRTTRTDDSTIGSLNINGVFECFVLEDKDRGLKQSMDLATISKLKVAGKTCIPSGRYEVAITFSNHFQRYLPLLLSVPGYEGVRIHKGNFSTDTEGCLLVGKIQGDNVIQQSADAFDALFAKLKAVETKEKIFITIE